MSSGIYQWLNLVNGKRYVGSATHLDSRKRVHRCDLRANSHYNKKLQNAWNKYGEENFAFIVLESVIDVATLRNREQHWIDTFNAVSGGYNILANAGSMLDYKHSAETKAKISAAHKGRKFSAERRSEMSAARMGTKQSPEQAARHSAFMTGRKPSAEHLAKQIAAIRRPEVRAKISAVSRGRIKSQEHLAHIREALARPEVQEKLRARKSPQLGVPLSVEAKARLSAKAKERWGDPARRVVFVEARRARAERERSSEVAK